MKKLVFAMVLLCTTATAQINSFPYFEDFEGGQGGWTSTTLIGGDSWNLGFPDGTVINQPAGGINSWYTDTLHTGVNEQSNVFSPIFDFTSVPNPYLEIDVWWDLVFDSDGAVLQSSIDGGSSWQNVGHHDDDPTFAPNWFNHAFLSQGFPGGGAGSQNTSNWTGDGALGSQGWVTAGHLLEGLGGLSNVMIRVAWINKSNNLEHPANGFAFDNVHIFDAAALDFSVDDVVQAGPCGGGYPGQALVTVTNFGAGPGTVTEFNDGLGTTFPVTSTIIPGQSSANILVNLPLQDPGSPNLDIIITDPGDFNTSNNSFSASFNCNVIGGAPHCNDFEAGNQSPWFVDPGSANSSWVQGPPNNNVINTPGGGLQSWTTTGPDGISNLNENSAIVSPFFDFSGNTNVGVEFSLFLDAEFTWDGAAFQFSTDGGQTWQLAGTQGEGTNWFNFGALGAGTGAGGQNVEHWSGEFGFTGFGWTTTSNTFPQLDGQSNVLFRFAYLSDDFLATGGVGVDDFCVTGETVAPLEIVINEVDGQDETGDIFKVELYNKETTPVDLSGYRLDSDDNTTVFSHHLSGTILAQDYLVFDVSADIPPSALFHQTLMLVNPSNVILDRLTTADPAVGLPNSEGTFAQPDTFDFASISRIPDGADTDDNAVDFAIVCTTLEMENINDPSCQVPEVIDVAILDIEQVGPCGGGFLVPLLVTLSNFGDTDELVTLLTDSEGGTHVIAPTLLGSGETAQVVILVTPSNQATSIDVTVTTTGDQVPSNDTFQVSLNCQVLEANGYSNDFEEPEEGPWFRVLDTPANSWNHGTNTDNLTINTPSTNEPGDKFWATNEGGSYLPNEQSGIVSPYFDFSNTTAPVFKAEIWVDLETDKDGVVLEHSIDGGNTWQTAGGLETGINWYNTESLPNGGAGNQNDVHWSGDGAEGTQGWVTAIQSIAEVEGETAVLLRLSLRSDTTVVDEGGFGFDNMEIRQGEAPEVVINEFNYVDHEGEQYDFVELKNTGSVEVQMESFELHFHKQVNGIPTTYQMVQNMAGPLGPGEYYLIGDTSGFLFPDLAVLLPDGAVLGDTSAIELIYIPTVTTADEVVYGDDMMFYGEGDAITMVDPGSYMTQRAGFSRLPDGSDTNDNQDDFFFRCITPGFTNEPNDSVCFTPELVINEFNYSDPSGEAFDFVELKNTTNEVLDLSNFELDFRDGLAAPTMPVLPLAGSLNPGDYYVIGAPNGVQNQDFTLNPASDYVQGPDGSIELIFTPNNTTADIVGYGSNFPGFDENGPILGSDEGEFLDYTKSFARFFDGIDTDDNHLDFILECHTPGEVNGTDTTCVNVMVINEVDKLGANGDSVFVELFNKTPILADLDGFILEFEDASNLDTIRLDGNIGNQGYRVFGIPSAGFDSNHVTIMLQDTQSTTIVDRLTIAETPVGLPNTENEFTTLDASVSLSISRIPNGEDTNENGNDFALVCATLGSENFNDLSCDVVGISEDESEREWSISIFPNPANGLINYKLSKNHYLAEIRLIDALGKVLLTEQNPLAEGQINLQGLPSGVYTIIATEQNGKSAVERFVKQ